MTFYRNYDTADAKLLIKPISMDPAPVETFGSNAQDCKSHSLLPKVERFLQIAFIMNTNAVAKL